MKQPEVKLNWEGETIKQEVAIQEIKITPKQMLDSLDHAKSQVQQMYQQQNKLEDNMKMIKKDIISAEGFIKEREVFEKKCLEIQMEKLKHYINQASYDCQKEAEKKTKEIIAESPDAYTEDQKKNMKFVNYQRLLATNNKIAENISKRIIQEHLFVKPIFSNPFKEEKQNE